MTKPNYRALCAELLDELQALRLAVAYEVGCPSPEPPVVLRARAELAKPEPARQPTFAELLMPPPRSAPARPEPPDLTDEEIDEQTATLIPWLLEEAIQAADSDQPYAAGKLTLAAQLLGERRPTIQPEPVALTDEELDRFADEVWSGSPRRYARAILARWGTPANQPVPVSERLPDPEDCDAEGRCWMFDPCDRGWWCYREALPSDGDPEPFTHWLPHWALPMPAPANNTRGTH